MDNLIKHVESFPRKKSILVVGPKGAGKSSLVEKLKWVAENAQNKRKRKQAGSITKHKALRPKNSAPTTTFRKFIVFCDSTPRDFFCASFIQIPIAPVKK